MPHHTPHQPRAAPQVMVSSTFTDLKEHRAALIKAIHEHKLHANVMEHDSAKPAGDVIDSSLQMVRDSAAYILVISWKYGQTPEDAVRNPDKLSITELEFSEAQRLERPILLFIMGDKHPGTRDDFERDPEKEKKLDAFRQRAKKASLGSEVNRVYAVFNSLDEFRDRIGSSLNELCQHLAARSSIASQPTSASLIIPKPPALYAKPHYIPRYQFIGRKEQLDVLSKWAVDNEHTILLFQAIGGNGKSALTWEWTEKHAVRALEGAEPWAGRVWYSFYERGATMTNFCRHSLAYMTGEAMAELEKKPFAELKDNLLRQLHAKPWLLILDGMERVLVHYHQLDPAEEPDEAADKPTDKIVQRDPCDAIRDEDNDLLRDLAGAAPSKILISSRILPRVLLNGPAKAIPRVCLLELPGLNDADSEAFLRSCGDIGSEVKGDSIAIQRYLRENCGNHPLTIGALGGLIVGYRKAPGDFTKWLADDHAGGALDLSALKLEQRRNHILKAALDHLSAPSRQLLSTLALIVGSVDYATIEALSPHRPPRPWWLVKPKPPEKRWFWRFLTEELQAMLLNRYSTKLAKWEQRPMAKRWMAKCSVATDDLDSVLTDLTRNRGLLQYDSRSHLYELHPVVRSVVTRSFGEGEKTRAGERILDHFTALPHNPYRQARTLADVEGGLHVARTLLKLGHFQKAADACSNDLLLALLINLEAHAEALSLVRPFFSAGWDSLPHGLSQFEAGRMADVAGMALLNTCNYHEALALHGAALLQDVQHSNWGEARICLANLSDVFAALNRPSKQERCDLLALELATACNDQIGVFKSRLHRFTLLACVGDGDAEVMWSLLDSMGRAWPRENYRPGQAETGFALFRFWQGKLEEADLVRATHAAEEGSNHVEIRRVHGLRGAWRLDQGDWALAAASFQEAVRMGRERGIVDAGAETGFALAKFHLRQLAEPGCEARRLAQLRLPAHRLLAMLWLALGDHERAKHHALAAYVWAWADGEPYVNRYELTRTTELLRQMNLPVPRLTPYDPAKDERFPWEEAVAGAILKLRAKKGA